MKRVTWAAACGLAVLCNAAFAAPDQTKEGPIKSVDAKARTFFLERDPRGLTFTVDDKTTFTLAGKPSTFAEAIKPDARATVTYSTNGEIRLASKVDVNGPPIVVKAPATQPLDLKPAATKPAARPGDYDVTRSFKIGGEGLWEYVTLDDQAKTLYVPRQGRTFALDAATGKILGEVPGKQVRGLAVATEAGRGFITNGRDNTVSVFDLKTYESLGKIQVDGDPGAVIYDPASKRVLVCCGEGKCLVPIPADIDLKTGKPEPAIDLGGRASGLVTDAQGSVYVAVFDSDEIAVIDTKAMSLLTKWPTGNSSRPTGISMDLAHSRLFVGLRTQRLSVVSMVDGREITGVAINAQIESTAFGNGKVFVACTDGTLKIVGQNTAGQYFVEQTLKAGEMARAIAVDSKTGTLYVPAMEFDDNHRQVRNSFKVMVLEKK